MIATQMRAAIANDPTESHAQGRAASSASVRHGVLAALLSRRGALPACGTAWAPWRPGGTQSSRARCEARREFVTNIADGYQKCAARGVLLPPEFNTLLTSTRQAVTEATALAERLSKLGRRTSEAWRPEINEQYHARRRRAAGGASQVRRPEHVRDRRLTSPSRGPRRTARPPCCAGSNRPSTPASRTSRSFSARSARSNQLIAGAENGDRAIDTVKVELTPELAASRQSGRDLRGARARAASGQAKRRRTRRR